MADADYTTPNRWDARRLASGRWQARIAVAGHRINAPGTFETREDAEAWIEEQRNG